jgi:SAM-dependent methyltransferase
LADESLKSAVADDRESYRRRIEQEIANYQRLFRGRLSQEVPSVWYLAEQQFADAIERKTGYRNLYQHVAAHVDGRSTVDLLGLGSGACGNELDGIAPLLRNQGTSLQLTCVDINAEILGQAGREAAARDVAFTPIVQDINELSLEPASFDVIVAYAALHHFVNLDRIAEQVNRALKPEGIFVTVDIPAPNGFRMRPATRSAVHRLWTVLPPQFKVDHTRYAEPRYATEYPDLDLSGSSFECINSEAILPALREHLAEDVFVPAHSIARRLLDTKFGPNYDPGRRLDAATIAFILELDRYYLDSGELEPETFFGSYRKKI